MGLVSSFHRPGGNVTGFYFLLTELAAKRLALLKELLPVAKRIAVLVNPTNAATADPTARDVAAASRALSLDNQVFKASTSGEIAAAFVAFLELAGRSPVRRSPIRSSIPSANNLWLWQRAMRFLLPIFSATILKPAA